MLFVFLKIATLTAILNANRQYKFEMDSNKHLKRKYNSDNWSECCSCGERGSPGMMTNVFNLSLRENETVVKPFAEILEFALSLEVSFQKVTLINEIRNKCPFLL